MKKSKKIRVFIAIPVNSRLKERVGELRDKYKDKNIRWISPENLHITLVPPWYEEKSKLKKLIDLYELIRIDVPPFLVNFNKISMGPNIRRPRLIWAKGKTPHELTKLKSAVEKTFSLNSEKRLYKLHLTIARIKKESIKSININLNVNWKTSVNKIALMESKLYRSGAEYEVLKYIKLNSK